MHPSEFPVVVTAFVNCRERSELTVSGPEGMFGCNSDPVALQVSLNKTIWDHLPDNFLILCCFVPRNVQQKLSTCRITPKFLCVSIVEIKPHLNPKNVQVVKDIMSVDLNRLFFFFLQLSYYPPVKIHSNDGKKSSNHSFRIHFKDKQDMHFKMNSWDSTLEWCWRSWWQWGWWWW